MVDDAYDIAITELSYRYPGSDADTLHELSIRIAPGEIFALLGPSGAGKSTTVKAILGLLDEFRGEVTIGNVSMRRPLQSIYQQIGVAFESPRFYPRLTARQNLELFASLYDCPTIPPETLLEPFGLAADLDTPVGAFSKGMQMRLNFCRAIMHRPAVVVLDEPTSGLDPVNAAVVKDAIRDLNARGATVLITTHNMEVADQLSDRVAFVVDGAIATVDAPRALKLRYGEPAVRLETTGPEGTERHDFPLEGIGTCQPFLAMLRDRTIETIHTQEVTLEEVFLTVTGRGLS